MARVDISMTDEEIDAYLLEQRTVRVATADRDGVPHAVPLWFVWRDGAMFLNSTLGNITVENMLASGVATGVVDSGEAYDELKGVTLTADAERLGDAAPQEVERAWSDKYLGGGELPYRRWRNRCWFRLRPRSVASWDFGKIPEARARRA